MAKSLLSDKTALVSFSILIGGSEIPDILSVISIHVENELNRIPFARIKMIDGGSAEDDEFTAGNSANYVPGKEIEIKMGYETKEKTVFKGIITKHAMKVRDGKSHLLVECRHEIVKMTIGRKNRVYAEQTDDVIVKNIINENKLSGTLDMSSTKFKHEQLVQHYATDWDFMLMRADINGLVVCADVDKIKIKEPDFSADPKYEIEYGITLYDVDIEVDARTQYSSVTAQSWNSDEQKMIQARGASNSGKLAGSFESDSLARVIDLKDYTIQTPTMIPTDMLKAWATAKHTKSKMAMIQGSVTFRGVDDVVPGDMLELKGLSTKFNGKIFVEGITHTIEGGEWKTKAKIGMSDEWYAETQAQINAPQTSGYTPSIQGLTLGVVKEIHGDNNGSYRIKVNLPTLGEESDNIWARMSNLYASNEAGIFFYPEIGDEVLVGFLNNDPQNPIILGSMFSKAKISPLEPNEKNNEKAIITAGQLKIHFEDEKKIITIETPGGNRVTLDDEGKSIILTDLNKNIVTMDEKGINLESSADIILNAKGKIEVTAGEGMSISAKQAISIESSGDISAKGMNVALEASVGLKAKGTATLELEASGPTTIKGAMVKIN